MLKRLAAESGIETPTADDLIRLDRKRPGKKLSNEDWQSPTDDDARIARMKDGCTRLAYKPEHAVDLDTGAVLAAPVHHAASSPLRWGDTKTLPETLEQTTQNLAAVGSAPTCEEPAELVADKGYHSRDGLKDLHDSGWKTRISEPAPRAARAVSCAGMATTRPETPSPWVQWANRRRLLSGVAKQAFKLRAEIVERAFALTLDRGGMRRTWLRGGDNVQKRYLIHIAGYNLGLFMRLLTSCGTPRRWAAAQPIVLWLCMPLDDVYLAVWIAMRKPPITGRMSAAER